MPNNLHDSTLILKLFKFILLYNLLLNFFDCNRSVLPSTSVNNTVTTFTQLSIILKLIKWNLIVLIEDPVIIHHIHEPLILVINTCKNLALNILFICSWLLKFLKNLFLFLRKLSDLLLLLFCQAVIVAEVPVVGSPSTWLHDQLLSELFDLHLHLFHLLHIWTIVIFMLILNHLLRLTTFTIFLVSLILLVTSSTFQPIRGQDLVLKTRLFLLGQWLTQNNVMIWTTSYLDRSRLIICLNLYRYIRERKHARNVWSILTQILRSSLRIAWQSLSMLTLQIWAPCIKMVLIRESKAMLEPTINFRDWLNWVLLRWTDLRNLNGIIGRNLITNTKLTLVVHTPGIYITSFRKCDRKLLTHSKISDHWVTCGFTINILTRFSTGLQTSRTLTAGIWNFLILTERHFSRILAYAFP